MLDGRATCNTLSFCRTCLVNQQNGVVHHQPEQNNKTNHGEQIERLKARDIQYPQGNHTTDCRQRQYQQHQETVTEGMKQGAHQQVQDDQRQYKTATQVYQRFIKLVGRATVAYAATFRQIFPDHRFNIFFQVGNGLFQ